MGMTNEEREIALYCLKASSDYHSEVCEECVKYPNCDHMIQDDVTETIIKALEQQPCEDCISKEEALKYSHIEYDDDGVRHKVIYAEDIEELPSVTPQQKATGSWVEKQVVDDEEVEIEQWQSARCSKCDKYHTAPYSYYFDDYKYCPNCGAKMEVEE